MACRKIEKEGWYNEKGMFVDSLLLSMALILTGCGGGKGHEYVAIDGIVIDEAGLPVTSATVILYVGYSGDSSIVQTDSKGEFSFRVLDDGTTYWTEFAIDVIADGYASRTHTIERPSDRAHHGCEITLYKPSPAKLELTKTATRIWVDSSPGLYNRYTWLILYFYFDNLGTESGNVTLGLYGYRAENDVWDNDEKLLGEKSIEIPGEAQNYECSFDVRLKIEGMAGTRTFDYDFTKLVCAYQDGTIEIILLQ